MPKIMPRVEPKFNYATTKCPEDARTGREAESELFNLQACTCGHDRLTHSQYLGKGAERVIILDCPHAGVCGVPGCKCVGFVYDTLLQGPESRKRRAKEIRDFKVVPPEGKSIPKKVKPEPVKEIKRQPVSEPVTETPDDGGLFD